MHAEYLKEHICEELDGAYGYIKMAIELKAMDPGASKAFAEMSAAELEHAKELYKMFGEYYKKVVEAYKEPPSYLVDIRDCLGESYPEKSAKILMMHEMYKK